MKNLSLVLFLFLLVLSQAQAIEVRLKDLITVKGVQSNPIIGYGLVIGLNGTGDGGGEITNQSLTKMFQKLGLNPKQEISSKNVAAVIVTAKLPPFGRIGQQIDVTISSIGDASSLAGGTLLVTPLKAGTGSVYALASGPLSIGGLSNGGKKFPTTAMIPNGATVQKELELNFNKKRSLRLSLKNSDFTTAARIEKTINQTLGGLFCKAKDSTTLDLVIPTNYKRNIIPLMAIIENLRVDTDQKAKIVINEKTGTIVASGDIKLSEVAISHGELSVSIGDDKDQGGAKYLHHLKKSTTLNDLVKSLNALGASSEDLISIFQALKKNGALIGDIELL